MSNYERYIVKESTCLKKRINWNTKKHIINFITVQNDKNDVKNDLK